MSREMTILVQQLIKALEIIKNRFEDGSIINDTAKRLANTWYEMSATFETPPPSLKWFPTSFEGMLIKGSISCSFLCPHHLFPVEAKVLVGIIPNGYTIGISKITRVIEWASRKGFTLQETLTKRIADTLWKNDKLKGLIVAIAGRHFCEEMRGIKKGSPVITIEERGKILRKFRFMFIQNLEKLKKEMTKGCI